MKAIVYYGPRDVRVTGKPDPKTEQSKLRTLISSCNANPAEIISHELSLEEPPRASSRADTWDEGWTTVIFKPGQKK